MQEAMKLRCSRRSYLQEPLKEEDVQFLTERIEEYNRAYGLHMELVCNRPEIFKGFRKSYGMFHHVENFIMLMGNTRDVYIKEKLGYAGEKLVLEASKRHLGTCWVGATFDKDLLKEQVTEQEELYCVIAIGYVSDKKSVKETILSKAMHRKGKTIEEMSNYTMQCPDWMKAGMSAVQLAPSAMFKQPVTFTYKEDNVYAQVENKRAMDVIDLGIAMLHFEIGAQSGRWIWGNPAVFKVK